MKEWNQGWKEKNVEVLGRHLRDDYQRIFYPKSLGVPTQSKETYLGLIGGALANAELEVRRVPLAILCN